MNNRSQVNFVNNGKKVSRYTHSSSKSEQVERKFWRKTVVWEIVKKVVSQFRMAVKVLELLSLANASDAERSTMFVHGQPESGIVSRVN